MNMKAILSRLQIILALAVIMSVSLFANGSNDSSEDTAAASDSLESPMLTAMVDAGTLPALEERLPNNPMVETVYDELGTHGGVMRKAWRGAGKDRWGVIKMLESFLVRYEDGEFVPEIAESYEINDDYTEFTFYLREGLKWSDGVPFTADDVMFYYDQIQVKDVLGRGMHASVKGATVEKLNDYAFKISFDEPKPLFLYNWAHMEFFTPAHYAKTILPEFIGQEKADALAEEQGFSDSIAMLDQKLFYAWLYADVPRLTAWVATGDQNDSIFKYVRNPYYFKVDAAGKQLPYIDEMHYYRTEDGSQYTLMAIAGDLDFQFRSMNASDFTILKENEANGGYEVEVWRKPGSDAALAFNPTYDDPNLRPLFQDARFRQAVSLCLNREQINEIAYDGMYTARQASMVPEAQGYDAEWEAAFTEYSPSKAEALLDEIGLGWDSKHEYRTFADGSTVEIIFSHRFTSNSDLAFAELAVDQMKAIGLKVIPNPVDRTLLQEMRDKNEVQLTHQAAHGLDITIENLWYVPTRVEDYHWSQFGEYVHSDGESGIKPVGAYADLVEAWDKAYSATDEGERNKYLEQIVEIHKENIFMIGVVGLSPKVVVRSDNMMNVPEMAYDANILRTPGNGKPWQFFYK